MSRDCSISVTVSRENTKDFTEKRDTFQQIQRFTVKIPKFYS
jgi:hypothetical protein